MRLVDIGYEPAFGARPLKRAILKAVQDPLAEELLAGGYPNGSHGAGRRRGRGLQVREGLSRPPARAAGTRGSGRLIARHGRAPRSRVKFSVFRVVRALLGRRACESLACS